METKQITKQKLELMCRNAGLIPEKRYNVDGFELFIADGFSNIPGIKFQKFGVEPEDFPNGCFGTLWFITKGEDNIGTGSALFFDKYHDPAIFGASAKKKARINSAKQHAEAMVKVIKKGDPRKFLNA